MATRPASRAPRANDGFDVVAVLAGDGTLNEAADGLAGTDTALAPLPGGSTNVYARTLGIPLDPVAATNVLLASLRRRAFTRVGLGRVNGRRFLFHTGLGFDAAVIRRVERYGELKRYASHPLHVLAAFETWFRHFDRSKPRFDLVLDTGERIEGCYFAIVSKTSPYTYLGPRPLVVNPDVGLHTALGITAFRSFRVTTLFARRGFGDGIGQVSCATRRASCSAMICTRSASRGADRSRIRPTATIWATSRTSTSTTRTTR